MVRAAISNAYYEARNKGQTMEAAADVATESLMKIIDSVHQNALGYGRALGEQAVLDSVLTVDMSEASLHTWKQAIDKRVEAAKQ
jgi:hypothetical protein